jgi:hypothetical protein
MTMDDAWPIILGFSILTFAAGFLVGWYLAQPDNAEGK